MSYDKNIITLDGGTYNKAVRFYRTFNPQYDPKKIKQMFDEYLEERERKNTVPEKVISALNSLQLTEENSKIEVKGNDVIVNMRPSFVLRVPSISYAKPVQLLILGRYNVRFRGGSGYKFRFSYYNGSCSKISRKDLIGYIEDAMSPYVDFMKCVENRSKITLFINFSYDVIVKLDGGTLDLVKMFPGHEVKIETSKRVAGNASSMPKVRKITFNVSSGPKTLEWILPWSYD